MAFTFFIKKLYKSRDQNSGGKGLTIVLHGSSLFIDLSLVDEELDEWITFVIRALDSDFTGI